MKTVLNISMSHYSIHIRTLENCALFDSVNEHTAVSFDIAFAVHIFFFNNMFVN